MALEVRIEGSLEIDSEEIKEVIQDELRQAISISVRQVAANVVAKHVAEQLRAAVGDMQMEGDIIEARYPAKRPPKR